MQNRKFHAWRQARTRVYTLCSFEPNLIVPDVQLIEAVTDEEAVACAGARDLCSLKELWDDRRLVAVIQPRYSLPARSAKGFTAVLAGYPHAIPAPRRRVGHAVLSEGIR